MKNNLKHFLASLVVGFGVNASAQCLNVNGDFESYSGTVTTSPNSTANAWINNDLNNWYVSHGSPTTGTSPSINMWMWSYNGTGEGVYTEYNFIAGQTYELSYRLWRDGTSNPDSEFRVQLSNGLSPYYSTSSAYPSVAGNQSLATQPWVATGTWVTVTETFTATSNYSQLWMHPFLAGRPNPWQAACRIDDVCVTKITDPCSFEPTFRPSYKEECNVTLTNTTVLPAGLTMLNSYWDFGDGTTGTGNVVNHYYANGGAYEVCLTVWAINEKGECCQVKTCMGIEAPRCEPCEMIERAKIKASGVNPFSFSVVGLPSGLSNVLGYHWTFGDGTSATGANVNHSYTRGGTYEVCVTIYYYDEEKKECCNVRICTRVSVKGVIEEEGDIRPKGATFEEGKAPVGAEEAQAVKLIDQVLVSPNPSNGEFMLEMRDGSKIENIKVLNQMGQVVYQTQNVNEAKNLRLDLSNMDKGTYFVIVNENDNSAPQLSKIVIQ